VDEQATLSEQLEQELRIAREIQLSLLPSCPVAPGWTFDAKYLAAREVSGDFYDFLYHRMDSGRLELVIGDVTGKGVPAALMMATSRAVLRAEAQHAESPAEVLTQANRILTEDRLARLFLSALHAAIDTRTGVVTYANAGHDRPLLIRAGGDHSELDAPGVILGAFRRISLVDCVIQLGPGDTLILYTDGVTEARNRAGELFGDERLLDAAVAGGRGGDAAAVSRTILDAVTEFTGGAPQADDLTLVVVQRRPD
jgi:phosphoserine phosphatase RsbU/P